MGYEHITVKQAKTVAASIADPYFKLVPEVQDFREAVEQSIRGVKTIARSQCSVYVYREGDSYVMGWIGYEDYQSHITGEKKYAVYARDIENCKYSVGSLQYYMRVSINLTTAVKNTKAVLRPYTTPEVAKLHSKQARDAVKELENKTCGAYAIACKDVGLHTPSRYSAPEPAPLLDEVMHMLNAGHTFSNLGLDQKLRDLMVKKKEAARFRRDMLVPMDFVHVYARGGKTYVASARVLNIREYGPEFNMHDTWREDELPDNIHGKISVMSICADAQFVEGVGYKVNDSMFYIYVEEAIA